MQSRLVSLGISVTIINLDVSTVRYRVGLTLSPARACWRAGVTDRVRVWRGRIVRHPRGAGRREGTRGVDPGFAVGGRWLRRGPLWGP